MAIDSKFKILIVDDLEVMRKILISTYQKMGYQDLHEAESGKLALGKIQEAYKSVRPFKLIVCDWSMSDMNGVELLKLIKADDKAKTIPVIMIFSEAEQQHVAAAVKAGVTNFLMKPFSMNVLEEKMAKIYGS